LSDENKSFAKAPEYTYVTKCCAFNQKGIVSFQIIRNKYTGAMFKMTGLNE
jgi:hypothetical protein